MEIIAEKLPTGVDFNLPIDIKNLLEFMVKVKLNKLNIDEDYELIERVRVTVNRIIEDIDLIEKDK